MNVQTATPREIDTALAEGYENYGKASRAVEYAIDRVMHASSAKRTWGRRTEWSLLFAEAFEEVKATAETDETYVGRMARDAVAAYEEATVARQVVLDEQIKPYTEEFTRRGGWTRGFLVTDGHVHKTRECSTCNNGVAPTSFYWLVEFSGRTEAEVVEAAADRACTVCYPTAPVETAGESALMTPDERTRAQQREDAAKAKEARTAKKIANGLTADGSEFKVTHPDTGRRRVPNPADPTGRTALSEEFQSTRTEYFKTEKAASMWAVAKLVDGVTAHYDKYRDYMPAVLAIVEAMAAKHGKSVEEVKAELNAKAEAKRKRDGWPEKVGTVL